MRGKYKPQRGRARRFTSSHDPNAYVTGRPAKPDTDDSDSDSENEKKLSTSDAGSETSTDTGSSSGEESDSSFEEIKTPDKEVQKLSLNDKAEPSKKNAPNVTSAATSAAPRELTRREREAIEKERARQYFLKMKEKEDAARLAIIRKKREEEAASHAAEQKAKEEARFNRR